jgi:predicted patatin/cPLA2 family phospholipase
VVQHTVLKNIIDRKGMRAPFSDGRKIGLVLPGGMMTCVNGAGAMCALEALGLTQAFDVIYTASGGFPNASYLLSDNTEVGSSIYYEELSGNQFINFWKFWEPVSFDRAIEAVRDIKPIDREKIWDSNTEVILRLSNYSDKDKKRIYVHLKDHSKNEYFDLLKAAISSPILTRCMKIDFKKLCDGQITNRDIIDHVRYALDSDCTDLLIMYNYEAQKDLTALSGNERYFEIVPTGASKISVFETRGDVLKKAHGAMKEHVLGLFEN